MSIKRGGHTFERVDKPIRTPNHPSGKSHAVVIKKGDGYRLIRFGMQGAKTKPPRKGESDADKAKRKRRKNETYNPSKKYFKTASGNTRPYKGAYGLYEA